MCRNIFSYYQILINYFENDYDIICLNRATETLSKYIGICFSSDNFLILRIKITPWVNIYKYFRGKVQEIIIIYFDSFIVNFIKPICMRHIIQYY